MQGAFCVFARTVLSVTEKAKRQQTIEKTSIGNGSRNTKQKAKRKGLVAQNCCQAKEE